MSLNVLQELISSDWESYLEEHDENLTEKIRLLFNECFKRHSYEEQGKRPIPTYECGSYEVQDTPKVLYRLLYLIRPEKIDFSDMDNSKTLIEFCSPCYNFCASIRFYNYELGVYFHCSKKNVESQGKTVIRGWPSADNGCKCISEEGNLWFNTLIECLNREYEIYPGNNFCV